MSRPLATNSPKRAGRGRALALLAAFSALLTACSDIYYDRRETVSLGAGDSLASNTAVQAVDPWPQHVGNKNIAFNGQRLQGAVERYRHHEVVRPVNPQTTTTSLAPPPITTEAISVPQSTTTAAPAAAAK
jgi:hypothetical protein